MYSDGRSQTVVNRPEAALREGERSTHSGLSAPASRSRAVCSSPQRAAHLRCARWTIPNYADSVTPSSALEN